MPDEHHVSKVSYADGNGRYATSFVCESGCPVGTLASHGMVIDSIHAKVQAIHAQYPERGWMAARAIAGRERRVRLQVRAAQVLSEFLAARPWRVS